MVSSWLVLVGMLGLGAGGVRKCCPPGEGLADDAAVCTASRHLWLYAELGYGLPECRPAHLTAAHLGKRAACVDTFENGTVAALVCPDADPEDGTIVPAVNLVGKCCPVDREFDSRTGSCWTSDGDGRTVQRLLNVLVSGFDGVVDVRMGFPRCSRSQALVDYLVPDVNLRRRPTEALRVAVPGEARPLILDPEETCVDVTQDRGTMVVRTCLDAELACSVHNRTCVRKCCPEGKHLRKGGCAESHRPLGPLNVSDAAFDIAFRYGDPCTKGKYILNAEFSSHDENYIDPGGRLYLPGPGISTDRYCVEDVLMVRENVTINGTYVFMCFPEHEVSNTKLTFWVPLGLMVSCFFLTVTFVVYACLPSLHNLHGKTLMCYVVSLLVGFLCLAAMQLDLPIVSTSILSCTFVASVGQFTFLAAFCWLNVISFDIWWTFGGRRLNAHIGRKQRDIRRFVMYSVYAWGAPLLMTALTIVADYYELVPDDKSNRSDCWFKELSLKHLLFFFLPQVAIVGSNVVFYVLTAVHCSRVKNELNRFNHTAREEKRFRADVSKLVMNVKLFVVMGMSWALDIVSIFLTPESWGWLLPDAANSLQGLLIFAIFVLKGKVLKALGRRLSCGPRTALKDNRHQRPSTSTLFTVVSSDCRPGQLTKSASDSKLNVVNVKRCNLEVSVGDLNGR